MTEVCVAGAPHAPEESDAAAPRLLGAAEIDIQTHGHRHGPVPWRGAAGLLVPEVREAGLTGRGGAGFPTWRKLAAVDAARSRLRRPVVVANAAEGEPASAKDVSLLVTAPHLVLDGLQLCAEAVGAGNVFVYVKPGPAARSVRRAIAEREARRGDRYRIQVHDAPDAFVSGEESSVVSALEGGPALPRFKRRLLVESGYRGRPTLVQNTETLAHLALLARHGAAWFRQVGTPEEPGTFLATVSGAVASPGVVEVAYGASLGNVLALAGGVTARLEALLVGGYHGGWLPAGDLDIPASRAALTPHGSSPGAGVVMALPAGSCGLEATAQITGYLARQSAGQCGPCLHGLPQLASTFAQLATGRARRATVSELEELAGLVNGRGACRHPDGTVRLLRSALSTFAADVDAHLRGTCTARAGR